MVISVINNKGGTGKTTTSVNLAAALAFSSYKVLLVDMDAQASASLSLGVAWNKLSPSLADVLFEERPIAKTVRRSKIPGLWVLTAEMDMASSDLMLGEKPNREKIFSKMLSPIKNEYDFIICDCPPSLSLISVNSLMASDKYIVPVVPEYLALEGLVSLMGAVERMKKGLNMTSCLMGILFTQVNSSLKSSRQIMTIIQDYYKTLVFKTRIPRDVKLSEAPSVNQTIFEFAPQCRGAEAYNLLSREMIKKF